MSFNNPLDIKTFFEIVSFCRQVVQTNNSRHEILPSRTRHSRLPLVNTPHVAEQRKGQWFKKIVKWILCTFLNGKEVNNLRYCDNILRVNLFGLVTILPSISRYGNGFDLEHDDGLLWHAFCALAYFGVSSSWSEPRRWPNSCAKRRGIIMSWFPQMI